MKLRSLLFAVWLYGLTVLIALVCLPFLLAPRGWSMMVIRVWSRYVLFGLRHICGLKVEVRGFERRPTGQALIAAKHQGMLDTVAPFDFLPDPAFVLKQELIALPFYGWFARRAGMIPVDREAHAKALKRLVTDSRRRLAEGRQIVIFPEGTRKLPDETGDYKPGVAALYRELDIPCTPMATNSGLFWPAHGLDWKPGVAVFELLEPIPAGLKRAEFMRRLEERIETATARLVEEGRGAQASG
jgi:1-acyl-sn-glycerol-3-phosphate acyltransferase